MQEGKAGLEKITEILLFIYLVFCLLLKKQERKNHFQYVHRVLALVFSVLVEFRGMWLVKKSCIVQKVIMKPR